MSQLSPNQIAIDDFNRRLFTPVVKTIVGPSEGLEQYSRLLNEGGVYGVSEAELIEGYLHLTNSATVLNWPLVLESLHFEDGDFILEAECDCEEGSCEASGLECSVCADESDIQEPGAALPGDGIAPRFAIVSVNPEGQFTITKIPTE